MVPKFSVHIGSGVICNLSCLSPILMLVFIKASYVYFGQHFSAHNICFTVYLSSKSLFAFGATCEG